jgi:OmpA-OmpF porin, OOP family
MLKYLTEPTLVYPFDGGNAVNLKRIVVLVFFLLVLSMTIVSTFAADIDGSKDHPSFKRYEGSEIIKYSFYEYDSYTIALGKAPNSQELVQSKEMEGAITRLTYKIPMGRSPLEVIRNYENYLMEGGFQVLFEGNKDGLGSYFSEAAGYDKIIWTPNIPALTLNSDQQRYLAVEKKSSTGTIVLALYAVENQFWASNIKKVEKGQTLLQVDIIESKPMEAKMVTIAAGEMAEKISTSGSIALYGIYFDTDKAKIKPESTDTLEQIAKLLKTNPELKLLVVGHTDNVGSYAYNMELSRNRASSVVNELTKNYAIKSDRLSPVGVAFACPVGSNKTDEGRTKNRRVELVEN